LSAALAGLGRREEAAAWASDALRAMPANLGLKPREMVEVAALNLQIGDSKRTRALASRLQSMGYRHPAFARSVVARAAA
jgi:hypothetical protein